MKKDLSIAVAVLVVVAALCFVAASLHTYAPPRKAEGLPAVAAKRGSAPVVEGNVVMRINGAPVTEGEFNEAFKQLPENVQQQFAGGAGRQAFAEQYVKLKLLELEGGADGSDRDPKVQAQLAAQQTNVLAAAAFQKLAKPPGDAEVRKFYAEHPAQFETVELSHIVVAVQGGQIPPRDGGTPPPEGVAMQKAQSIAKALQSGADFAQLAQRVSDDPQSAQAGGKLGPFSRGMLPPEIEAQIFSMKPGEISGPLPSRFGFHIFKVGPRNLEPLERVKPFIVRQLQQQQAFNHVEQLRKNAKVEFDPKFFPDAGKTPGVPPIASPRRPS